MTIKELHNFLRKFKANHGLNVKKHRKSDFLERCKELMDKSKTSKKKEVLISINVIHERKNKNK